MADDYVLFLGILIGSVAVWLLPCMVAWIVAHKASLGGRYGFAIASCVLAYGSSAFLFFLIAPLSLVATHLAPEWSAQGHETLGSAVIAGSHYAEYLVLALSVALLFLTPFWLKPRWSSIREAMRANSSSKPTPLRGAA